MNSSNSFKTLTVAGALMAAACSTAPSNQIEQPAQTQPTMVTDVQQLALLQSKPEVTPEMLNISVPGTKCVLEGFYVGYGRNDLPWFQACHPLGTPEAEQVLSYERAAGATPRYAINKDCFRVPSHPFGWYIPTLGKKDSITPCYVVSQDGQAILVHKPKGVTSKDIGQEQQYLRY